jgi:protein-tyrosine phosphatase
MIDIHCHLLPGLDDGARNLEESLAMARIAVADGIQAIVVTPHTNNGIYSNPKEDILNRLKILQEVFSAENIPIHLFPGADIHFNADLIPGLEKGEILPINKGRYLLLELEKHSLPLTAKEIFFDLRVKGYQPIVTHPERNSLIQHNPELILEWVRHGAIIQITAGSLMGTFGGRAANCAAWLLAKGLVHIIASDAHSWDKRPPVLSKALKKAEKLVGRTRALKLVEEFPKRVLISKPLPEIDFSETPAKKHFFLRLFGVKARG